MTSSAARPAPQHRTPQRSVSLHFETSMRLAFEPQPQSRPDGEASTSKRRNAVIETHTEKCQTQNNTAAECARKPTVNVWFSYFRWIPGRRVYLRREPVRDADPLFISTKIKVTRQSQAVTWTQIIHLFAASWAVPPCTRLLIASFFSSLCSTFFSSHSVSDFWYNAAYFSALHR